MCGGVDDHLQLWHPGIEDGTDTRRGCSLVQDPQCEALSWTRGSDTFLVGRDLSSGQEWGLRDPRLPCQYAKMGAEEGEGTASGLGPEGREGQM